MNLEEVITEEFVLWHMAWGSRFEPSPALIVYWAREMHSEGITPEQFRAASAKLRKQSEWPPSVAEFLKAVKPEPLPAYYREFKALLMPDEPPITPEQKKEIVNGMKPGAKEMFLSVLYGDDRGQIH